MKNNLAMITIANHERCDGDWREKKKTISHNKEFHYETYKGTQL